MPLSRNQLLAVSNFRAEIAAAMGPAVGAMHFADENPLATTIAVAGTFVKAANVSDDHGSGAGFSMPDNNQIRWDGEVPIRTLIIGSVSYQCAANNQSLAFAIAQNGTVDIGSQTRTKIATGTDERAVTVVAHPTLQPGDYIELWLTNNTSTGAVTVTHCHFIAIGFYP